MADDQTQPPGSGASSGEGQTIPLHEHIAVKKGLEDKLAEVTNQSTEAATKLQEQVSELTNTNSQLVAKVKTLEESGADAASAVEQLGKMKADHEFAVNLATHLGDIIIASKRDKLSQFGIPAEDLDGRNLSELNLMETALKSVSPPSGDNYATRVGGGGSGAPSTMTPQDRAKRLIAQEEERKGVAVKVSESSTD